MKKIQIVCLLALVSASLPATADHHGDCYPPSLAAPVSSLTRACYGHYQEAARCGTWYSTDGYDEDRVIVYALYARAIASSGESSTCTGTDACTSWHTRATVYTNPFYAGAPIVGAVRLQSAQYDAAMETTEQGDSCGEPTCTLSVAADNEDAQVDDEVPVQLPACQTVSDADKPTPGAPGTTVPEDICIGASGAMACYEQETLYDPYGGCDGRSDEAWLSVGDAAPLRAVATYTCYEYGDFWTGPCWIRSRTIEVTGGGATLGIQRTFSDNCWSPIFNPGTGSCSTRIWFEDSVTGYSDDRYLPTTPSVQCADLAYN